MSREDVAKASRKSGVSDEDVSDLMVSATSRVWNLENDTTNGQHYTAAGCQPTNQVSAWQAGRGSRPTSPYNKLRGCRACRRGCDEEDATRKLLVWNLCFTTPTRAGLRRQLRQR